MKVSHIIPYILLLVAAVPATAQPAEDSLLVHYRNMALEYDDGLKSAAKRINACTEMERAARSGRIPSISAGGDVRYTGNPLEYSATIPDIGQLSIQGQNWRYGASATLSQPVYTGGRISGAIRVAESDTRMSEAEHELMRTEVCYRVDVQYWTTVARLEMTAVAEEYLNAVADLERIVRERVEAGLCDHQELLTVEVKHNEARYRLSQAQSDFETGRMALNALIGRPLEEETPVSTSIPETSAELPGLQETHVHPRIALARERVDRERYLMRLNDAQYKPQLTFGANAGYFSPGYNLRPDFSPNYTLYAQLSVPIFNGGKRHRERRAAEYRIGMASDDMHNAETDISLETGTARTALAEAQERVALAASSLTKACENERRATEKYAEGAISISDVIDAQIYRQTAQQNLVAAKAAVRIHLAELKRAADAYRLQ